MSLAGLDPEHAADTLMERMDPRENPVSGQALEDSIVMAFVAAIDGDDATGNPSVARQSPSGRRPKDMRAELAPR